MAFAERYKKAHPECRILVVTGERGRFLAEKAKQTAAEVECEFLTDFPFPRSRGVEFFFQLCQFLLKFVRAFWKSGEILKRFQPDLSVGFGSYVAFPGLWESHQKKIPTLVHEQNRSMGQANAWIARFADRIAVSFEENGWIPPQSPRVVTGLPLRLALVESAERKNRSTPPLFSSDRMRILILGGSQGSRSLNYLWWRTLDRFSHEEKKRVAVIHITGREDYEKLRALYRESGVEAKIYPFYERMEELYPEADLAVTRAGAGTLFELALFALPAVVVPYPHAEAHQESNARYFEERGGAITLLERKGESERMKREILELMKSPGLRNRMAESLRRIAIPDGAERLVAAADALLEERMVREEVTA